MPVSNAQITPKKNPGVYGGAALHAMANVGKECPAGHASQSGSTAAAPVDSFVGRAESAFMDPSSSSEVRVDAYMELMKRRQDMHNKTNSFLNLRNQYANGQLPQTSKQLARDLKVINGINDMYCPHKK